MKQLNMLLALGLIVGCAGTGIVPTGENEYMVSKTDIGDTWSDGSRVLAKLYREANDFCGSRNMFVERIEEEKADGRVFVRNASATLRFRCKQGSEQELPGDGNETAD